MQNFEQIRTHIAGNGYRILMQEPYVMCVELSLEQGTRHQAIFLSEMQDDDGRDYLRVSTAVAPTTGLDAKRALKWTVIERIVWAWILTIPAAGGVAWLLVKLLKNYGLAGAV